MLGARHFSAERPSQEKGRSKSFMALSFEAGRGASIRRLARTTAASGITKVGWEPASASRRSAYRLTMDDKTLNLWRQIEGFRRRGKKRALGATVERSPKPNTSA
jgi:hypothetical protein